MSLIQATAIPPWIGAHPQPFMETHMPQFHMYPSVAQNIPRPTYKGPNSYLGATAIELQSPSRAYQDYIRPPARPIAIPGMQYRPAASWRGGTRGLGDFTLLYGRDDELPPHLPFMQGPVTMGVTTPPYDVRKAYVNHGLFWGGAVGIALGFGLGFWLGRRKR